MYKNTVFTLIILAFLGARSTHAQVDGKSELFITVMKLDSIMFERGFNQCDLPFFDSVVSDKLKFYHDQSGIQDKITFLDNIKEYICSTPERKPIRKLVMGSLEVFPLYNNGVLYGAIQRGEHYFYIREPEKADVLTNIAKFTSVWTLEDGEWMYTEGLSYDHKKPEKTEN